MRLLKSALVLLGLVACFGIACGKGSSTPTVAVSGTVSGPGGLIAFNGPTFLDSLFAGLIGTAHASISGTFPVDAGATVNLIEIDASGTQVGSIIAAAKTDTDGRYTLNAPEGFSPGSKYVVRVEGATGSLDAIVTSTSVDVDPLTDAVRTLITDTAGDLSVITPSEIDEIQDEVDGIVQQVDLSNLTASQMSAALKTEAENDEEASNVIGSAGSPGQICGKVTDAGSTALANIKVLVKDFGEWVKRAKTKTDAKGEYCVNVPYGDYILGVINNTASMAAGEWWTSGSGSTTQFAAEKITVSDSITITRDFQLADGGRITGSVTAGAGGTLAVGAALKGVKILARSYDGMFPVTSSKVNADGSFRLNLEPGTYLLEARNRTLNNYGSETYDGADGTFNRNLGTPVTVTSGNTGTINFVLDPGYIISGQVLDSPGGNQVAGVRVRFGLANGSAGSLRTNNEGKYAIVLAPGTYTVQSRGQSAAVDISSSSQAQDFSAAVGTVSVTVNDANSEPVNQAKLYLWTTTNESLMSQEITISDGTATLYVAAGGSYRLQVRIDDGQFIGSSIYLNKSELARGTRISIGVGNNIDVPIDLPAGGTLTGTVYEADGITPAAGVKVEVRSNSTGSGSRFVWTRTSGNGSFSLSLPARTYTRVLINNSTNINNVTITADNNTDLGNISLP